MSSIFAVWQRFSGTQKMLGLVGFNVLMLAAVFAIGMWGFNKVGHEITNTYSSPCTIICCINIKQRISTYYQFKLW